MDAARPATEGDLQRLARLCRQALDEIGGQARGGAVFREREARSEPVEDGLRAALASSEQTLVVGTFTDVVVGYGTARVEQLRDGTRLGVIDGLYVEPGARGVGVGEAIMGELLRWCGAQRCTGVDALALPGMRATKNFFEASGFSARLLVMHRRMPDAET